jgi:hypothetical protein
MQLINKKTLAFFSLVWLLLPQMILAADPWEGLKNISINNKEDYKSYCSTSGATDNIRLMRCDVTVYDPKGSPTKFQFDAIKKTYNDYLLVNDKRLDLDVKLKLNYSPNNDNYSIEGINYFYKEDGPNKTEYGQAGCKIETHCCCASIKDAAGNITGVDEKNCKQTFCDCGANQRDITFCGVEPKKVTVSGSTTETVSCGAQKCTKTDKECKINNDCTGYNGVGICKNNFCFLDPIGLEKYKATASAFGVKADIQIKKPILEINIPQLKFSDIENTIDEEGYIHIPYIGEYISAVYKVLMVIASIIAVAMIVVVGVKITVIGGEERVAGFKKIGQIIIGLFIAWGSYAILYNINPDLVTFQTLKVKYIEPIDLQTISLTASDLADAAIGEGATDKFKYFNKCPVNLTQPIYYADGTTSLIPDLEKKPAINSLPKNIPRRLEFHEKMVTQQILKGPMAQRVAMATEAAAQCQIQYENCGVGTTNVYALAAATGGSYGASERCLKHAKNTKKDVACNSIGNNTSYSPKKILHDVTNLKTSYGLRVTTLTRGMICSAKCSEQRWPEPCFNNEDQATAKLINILKATGKWDQNWINELKPGDYYMIVNWNSYCPGTHSALFLGWKDPVKHIAWVQMGDAGNFIRVGTKNLGKEAIIQISRPIGK